MNRTGLRHDFFLPFLAAQLLLVTVHAGLATTGRINVWEFGGYGMYATPPPMVRIQETAIQPAIAIGAQMPELTWTRLMRRELHAGGCWFGRQDRIIDAVVTDMAALDLRRIRAAFVRRGFNREKTALIWEPMAALTAVLDTSGMITITNSVCGETTTVTRRLPVPPDVS